MTTTQSLIDQQESNQQRSNHTYHEMLKWDEHDFDSCELDRSLSQITTEDKPKDDEGDDKDGQKEILTGNLCYRCTLPLSHDRAGEELCARCLRLKINTESLKIKIKKALKAKKALEAKKKSSNVQHRNVQFSHVEIRDYDRVVGAFAFVKDGAPLSLGWNYNKRDPVSIDDYESNKTSKGLWKLCSFERIDLLHNVFGISKDEMGDAANNFAYL